MLNIDTAAMRERIHVVWGEATPLKRGLLVAVPAAVLALLAAGGIFAASAMGGSDAPAQAVAPAESPTDTAVPATATPQPSPVPTETPASAGLQASTNAAPSNSGAARSGGGGAATYRTDGAGQTGPGPALSTGMTLSIPSIGVNATVNSRTVGTDGQMGNPTGPWDVIWYDFSQEYYRVGGYPGQPGANAVFAGHVDYIRVGPAVFWSVKNLAPGDIVTVYTSSGPINYSIQWSTWTGPNDDFSPYVSQNGQETITLVTCIGGFSAGEYTNRLVVRGIRV